MQNILYSVERAFFYKISKLMIILESQTGNPCFSEYLLLTKITIIMLLMSGCFLLGVFLSFIQERFTPYPEMQIELRNRIKILSMQEEIQKECERNRSIFEKMANWSSSNRNMGLCA